MTYFKIATAIAMLLCLAPMPYGYYMLVRIAAVVAFGAMACDYAKGKRESMLWICVAAILLFQPFFKIPLGRGLWNVVDIVAALFIGYNVREGRKPGKKD